VATDVRTPELDFLDLGYGKLARILDRTEMYRRLYLSNEGKTRLAHIHGWLTGLYAAGQQEMAEKLVRDLREGLDYLVRNGDYCEYDYAGLHYKVPSRKVVACDDGTFHGLSVSLYEPVHPKLYAETRSAVIMAHPEWYDVEVDVETDRRLSITRQTWFGAELKETIWDLRSNEGRPVYYAYSFNGGFLYHGPGKGEVFAVRIGDTSRAWGLHT
jgi:hypothetical protein